MNPSPKLTSRLNHQWRIAARPDGLVKESDFEWREEAVPALQEGQILVRNVYLSLDPTNRVWMNDVDTYLPKLPLGAIMRGVTIAVVEESRHPEFQPGDIVQGLCGWQEYSVESGAGLVKLPKIPGLSLTAFFGAMGHIGFTSYFGLLDIGHGHRDVIDRPPLRDLRHRSGLRRRRNCRRGHHASQRRDQFPARERPRFEFPHQIVNFRLHGSPPRAWYRQAGSVASPTRPS